LVLDPAAFAVETTLRTTAAVEQADLARKIWLLDRALVPRNELDCGEHRASIATGWRVGARRSRDPCGEQREPKEGTLGIRSR